MIISTLQLNTGAIHYTTDHDAMTPDQFWAAWKNGKLLVFHMLKYQTRKNGYFDPDGNWITYQEENA